MFKFDNRTTRTVNENRHYHNRKPYRTKEQKIEARKLARKVNGTWKSNAPVSYHKMR